MKTITIFTIIFLGIATLFSQEEKTKKAQHFLEPSLTTSLNARISGNLTYRLNVHKFSFSIQYAYGLMGQKRLNNVNYPDAYRIIPSGIFGTNSNYRFDYFHRFIGHDVSIGLGGQIPINDKNTILLSAKLGTYIVKGYFKYTNISEQNNTFYNGDGYLKTIHPYLGFEVLYFYRINNFMALKTGIELQYIGSGQHKSIGDLYKPINNKYPIYGLKPCLTVGLQFNLKQNK